MWGKIILSIFVKEILNTKVCLNLNISKTQQKLIKTQHMKKTHSFNMMHVSVLPHFSSMQKLIRSGIWFNAQI
ncbi:hypothetical protein EG345_20760 [Chryseobacterium carnipullorum]|nr:hypothetical protein EG345_20760 [Chryseobacterium carnipullorum]